MALPQIVYVRPGPAMLLESLHFLAILFIIALATRIVPIWTVQLPAGSLALPVALSLTMVVRQTYSANDAWWCIGAAVGLFTLAALLTAPIDALPASPGFTPRHSPLHWSDFITLGMGYLFGEFGAAAVWNYARRNDWSQFSKNFSPVFIGQVVSVLVTWPVLLFGQVADARVGGLLFARLGFVVITSGAMTVVIAWATIRLHRYHHPDEAR